MHTKVFQLFDSFRARLSRRIVLGAFVSLAVIEAIVLVPSYYRRQEELFYQLEEVSDVVVRSIISFKDRGIADQEILDKFFSLTEKSEVLGLAIYSSDGRLAESFGELPEIPISIASAEPMVRQTDWQEWRYDVAWSADMMGIRYTLIVRHDAASVARELRAFTWRVIGLVAIISVFVTFCLFVFLGVTVIVPILRLRDDLIAAGEALSQEQMNAKFYSFAVERQDELGEVMKAFHDMYCRIANEIQQRKRAEVILRIERQKSENLLLNILPVPIAEELKKSEGIIAQEFSAVTILFADIVGFTELSARTHPKKLICLLNEIFSAFDRLTGEYGLEKIKTIGDAYMVVGGLPYPRSDHAKAVAEFALAMQVEIDKFNHKHGENFRLRIGMNTGPAIAGVIGTKKFIYDLWGDTVNTASRMESHGIPDRIQVTEATYKCLRSCYCFERRGAMQIKGKGEMVTYFLLGKRCKEEVMASQGIASLRSR